MIAGHGLGVREDGWAVAVLFGGDRRVHGGARMGHQRFVGAGMLLQPKGAGGTETADRCYGLARIMSSRGVSWAEAGAVKCRPLYRGVG